MNEFEELQMLAEMERQYEEIIEENRREAQYEYEISPNGRLEKYKKRCLEYIEEYKTITDKRTYEEKIDKLFDKGIELIKEADKMLEEITIDDIGLAEEDTDYNWVESAKVYFEEVIRWRDRIHYGDYNAENLVHIYE